MQRLIMQQRAEKDALVSIQLGGHVTRKEGGGRGRGGHREGETRGGGGGGTTEVAGSGN